MIGPLELVDPNDPILRTELTRFDFDDPPVDPYELASALNQKMIIEQGLGLAANQVGLPHRVFVLANAEARFIACFNPKIVDSSMTQILLEEGCLSYPGLYIKIRRPKIIKVRYTQSDGTTVTRKFDGLTARAFQHELDHLNGIVHIDRATKLVKEVAIKKWKKRYGKN